MTGIDRISSRIEADAQAQGAKLIEQARFKATEIEVQYAAKASDLTHQLRDKSRAEAEESRRRAVGVAELEARKRLLAAKQQVLDEAFNGALQKLDSLPEEELVALLARLAASASRDGGGQIVLNPADHNRFGKKVCEQANAILVGEGKSGSLSLSAEPRNLGGGGLLVSSGEVVTNCTFASIVASLRSNIVGDVAKKLF